MVPRPFFIIGAQKGGTTALFEYLRGHPEVYMPPEKEVEFFTEGEPTVEGWAEYRSQVLEPKRAVRVIGTASPQYMCDPAVPARLAALVPEALLIAVLRDPVERAVSHYKMTRRRGEERRSFAEAIREQLEPAALARTRTRGVRSVAERDAYVAWGEYARILHGFLDHFPRDRLLLLYSEDLREHSAETLARVYEFLRIDTGFVPEKLTRLYHVGGPRRRIPGLEKFLRSFVVRGLLRLGMRKRTYKRLQLNVERWNVKPGGIPVPADTYAALRRHYTQGSAELTRLTGVAPRWFQAAREDPLYL